MLTGEADARYKNWSEILPILLEKAKCRSKILLILLVGSDSKNSKNIFNLEIPDLPDMFLALSTVKLSPSSRFQVTVGLGLP